MDRKENKNLIYLTGMAVLAAMLLSGCGKNKVDLDRITDAAVSYEKNILDKQEGGAAYGNEWTVIALARSQGMDDVEKEAYLTNLAETVCERKGILSKQKNTEYSRTVLAVSALGADPTDVSGYDLTKPLLDHDTTASQGLNGSIFAILALQAAGEAEKGVLKEYVQDILDAEMDQGGYALSDVAKAPDPDMTAMALQALAYYQDTDGVPEAIERGVQVLAELQDEEGGYTSWGDSNSESVSQVILALSALEIDCNTDPEFQRNGKGLLDRLAEFQKKDGSFSHLKDGDSDQMATDQALCALASVQLLLADGD